MHVLSPQYLARERKKQKHWARMYSSSSRTCYRRFIILNYWKRAMISCCKWPDCKFGKIILFQIRTRDFSMEIDVMFLIKIYQWNEIASFFSQKRCLLKVSHALKLWIPFIAVLFTLQRACGLHNNILYNPFLLVNSNVNCQALSSYCSIDHIISTLDKLKWFKTGMSANQGIRALFIVNWVTVSKQNCQICHFFSALSMYINYMVHGHVVL